MTKKELKELLDSLTLKEKIGQMFQALPHIFGEDGAITGIFDENVETDDIIATVGSIINMYDTERMKKLQEKHLKSSKIPLLFMNDIIHGFNTIFPISPALAATFNPELIKETARIAAKESAAFGINVTFSPMVDISRDARWGRVCEGYGEDTYLSSICSKSMVEGYQGESLENDDTIAACVKHFALYGAPYDGRDYNNVDMSERLMRNDYLPPYKAAVDANVAMIMTAFNNINGTPATINHHTNVDILRDEWGFDGVSITDYGSAKMCYNAGVVENHTETAGLLVENKVDIDMMGGIYGMKYLGKAVENGAVSVEQIDECVMRILELKNKLGLFENPYKYFRGSDSISESERVNHRAVARRSVSESSTLVKNENNLLPIAKDKKVAFIGPFVANNDLTTHWAQIHGEREIGLYINEAIESFGDLKGEYSYSIGCPYLSDDEELLEKPENPCENDAEMHEKEAIKQAKNADTVIMLMGEPYQLFGESGSRTEITIPDVQMELLRKISKVNENIVVVLFNGRPLMLSELDKLAKSIVVSWYPGSQGYLGICDMLFGYTSPSGRLPFSFPRKSGQVPLFYSNIATGHDHEEGQFDKYVLRYIDTPNTPLYPFGYGLSYTEFKYSNLSISSSTLKRGENISVSVDIENIGKRDGYETAQLYIRDVKAKLVARPLKELKGFEKVFLKSGEKKTVTFEITEEMLKFYDKDCNFVAENGEFIIYVGAHSMDNRNSVKFELI